MVVCSLTVLIIVTLLYSTKEYYMWLS